MLRVGRIVAESREPEQSVVGLVPRVLRRMTQNSWEGSATLDMSKTGQVTDGTALQAATKLICP